MRRQTPAMVRFSGFLRSVLSAAFVGAEVNLAALYAVADRLSQPEEYWEPSSEPTGSNRSTIIRPSSNLDLWISHIRRARLGSMDDLVGWNEVRNGACDGGFSIT